MLAIHSNTKMCLCRERYPQELLHPYLSPYPSSGGKTCQETILGGTAVIALDCPLHVFLISLGPHHRILGRNIKTGPGWANAICRSSSLFVEMSHFLNISHQYPPWGIIYPSPAHILRLLIPPLFLSTQFKCSSILLSLSSVF